MGRLFWKFFVAILLAQVLATVGIGSTFWLQERARHPQLVLDIDTSPPAEMAIEAAAATLQFGGTESLRELLANMTRFRVYAVDENRRDLLGRVVKHEMMVEARYVLTQADKRGSVRDIMAKDGHRYLLFLPSREHLNGLEEGRGPRLMFGILPTGRAMDELRNPPRGEGRGAPPPRPRDGAGMPAGAATANADTGAGAMAAQRGSAPPSGPPMEADGPDGAGPMPMQEMRGGPLAGYRPFMPLIGATLGSLLCAFLLAWYFSRPIRDLRLAFEAASGGDLAPRFSGKSGKRGDELHDLGRDFDRMTGRLRSLMDGQTRLLHDVSHELRSPLARLQAAIGLAHQQPDKVEASLTRIERESVRMDKLVGELLTLSRLEAGALRAAGETINMADLVGEIASDAEFEASACERHVKLNQALALAGPDTDLQVLGQPDLLARAIENVVRNAIKHSPVGGTVEIDMRRLPGHGGAAAQLSIAVRDRGPGVADSDLQAIFEPFFRGEHTQKDTEGHGLGLAIAMHVVSAHGGAIVARNRAEGGLAVEITLPVATAGKRA